MSCAPGTSSRPTRSTRRRPAVPASRFAPIFVHEDKVPEIVPIPFKLDDEDDPSLQTPKPPKREKRYGSKLDQLPHIYHTHRLDQLSTHQKLEIREKKPRDLKKSRMKIFSDDEIINRALSLKMPKYKGIERLQRNIKKKVIDYIYKTGKIKFKIYGNEILLTRKPADLQRTKILKGSIDSSIVSPYLDLTNLIDWINSFDLSDEFASKIMTSLKNGAKQKVQNKSTTAQSIGVSKSQLKKFDILKVDVNLIRSSPRAIAQDLLKMLALTAWQKGDFSKCLFFLSEAQAHFSRRDIMDKHAAHFVRKNERHRSQPPPTPQDEKRDSLFTLLSSELRHFTKTQGDFEENLKLLNPEWNVVQLTKLFYHKNRFGLDLKSRIETPAIFIAALININGNRQPFVTYQAPPKVNPGVTKLGVIETLKLIMLKNRKINEDFKGNTHRYWDMRSQHNNRLKSLLATIEESWLFPWEFLLPGNIIDRKVVKSITLLLTSLEAKSEICFTPRVKAVLYKLIENYNMLQPVVRDNLSHFLSAIVGITSTDQMAKAIAKCGAGINSSILARSPTILVLDQEFDMIPWESLSCLSSTPVTRVPAIPLINALSVLQTVKQEKYGEIVDRNSCGYVLNPDGTLKGVEERLDGYLKGNAHWTGIVRQKPKPDDIVSLFEIKDIYLYCGHGNGSYYLPEHRVARLLCRAIPLLMGCGSLKYKHHGPRSVSTSMATTLFSTTCVSAVGFLYEITDLECDRVTLELLERWAPGAKGNLPRIHQFDPSLERPVEKCLATAVRLARSAAMQFMTSASLVYYGIPSVTHEK